MNTPVEALRTSLEESLWPLVEAFIESHDVAGLAIAVVRDGEVVLRGFGVRNVGTGAPVTPETMFHMASVSKPFVAAAIVSLATAQHGEQPVLDLDAPITEWLPEFTLADGRAGEVTARGLLSHSSIRAAFQTSRTTAGTTLSWAMTHSASSLAACRVGD